MKFTKEFNEYVVGFVLKFDDGRVINVQYELNRASNHPQPDIIPVIGATGDETIFNFTDDEQEEIRANILNDDDINALAASMTKIFYSHHDVDFYEMSLDDILSYETWSDDELRELK
jgi:hypothetical protein